MKSHGFRVGSWKKRVQTTNDHFHFLMNSTNSQRSFIHEMCSQKLGNPPSNLWGVPIPRELHADSDPATLHFVMHASKQAPHEFGRLISSHKKASGFISSLGTIIGDSAKAAGGYAKSVAGFVGRNGEAIRTGIGIVKDLVQTGSTIAQITGLIQPKTKSQIDSIADAIHKHSQATKPKPVGAKKGGLIII